MSDKKFKELIHNLGNALFSVSGLILSKKFDEARIKLDNIFGSLEIDDFKDFKPIDLLFKSKIRMMKKYEINFFIGELKFPKIDDADLCVIFGNIIDNCINFSRDSLEKLISISFKIEDGNYIYLFSNSFLYVPCDENSRYEIKEKIGLKTLRKILMCNGGNMRFWIKKNIFNLEISIAGNKIKRYD